MTTRRAPGSRPQHRAMALAADRRSEGLAVVGKRSGLRRSEDPRQGVHVLESRALGRSIRGPERARLEARSGGRVLDRKSESAVAEKSGGEVPGNEQAARSGNA